MAVGVVYWAQTFLTETFHQILTKKQHFDGYCGLDNLVEQNLGGWARSLGYCESNQFNRHEEVQ